LFNAAIVGGRAGFTLLEAAIVMAIVGLLSVVAVPKLTVVWRGNVARGSKDRFALAHSLARSTALRYGRLAQLHVDAPNARFWVDVDTSSGNGVLDTVGLVHDLQGQVTMTSTRSLLCFDSRGLAVTRGACGAPDATVTFAVAGRTDTVTVTALGKVVR